MERALTLTAMQSLWHLLLKAIPTQFREDTKDFSKLYGEAAFQTVMHRIGLERPVDEVKVQATAGSDRRHSYQGVANVSHGARKHIVVPGEIPPASDSDARDTIKRLSNLKGPLPIAEMPAVDTLLAIQSILLNEFPWAYEAIDAIFEDMAAQRR